MKRIIALILVALLSLSFLVSCGTSVQNIDAVLECYSRSYPHKITIESSQQFGSQTLLNTTVYIRGAVGSDFAAKKIVSGEAMRSIEDGSGKKVYGPIEEFDEELWYRNSKGLSDNKGKSWDENGTNFFPTQGSFALNLEPALLSNSAYTGDSANGKLTFVVRSANTERFFGEGGHVDTDVSVSITTAGGMVSEVVISWVIPANLVTGVDTLTVNIKSVYEYDQQRISFD